MARKRIQAAPEWAGQRQDENPEKWRGATAAPLIAATLGDARRGLVEATTDPSAIGELLRTFALVQARYGLVDLDRTSTGIDRDITAVAHQYWLQELTNRVNSTKWQEWNDGTGAALARSIGTITDEIDAFDAALPHLMTGNMAAITRALAPNTPHAVDQLRKLRRVMTRELKRTGAPSTIADDTGKRHDDHRVRNIAHEIIAHRQALIAATNEKRTRAILDGDGDIDGGGTRSPHNTGEPLWVDLVQTPNKLTRPHIGKIGAKRSPSDSGRTIKHPSRALTDPARRVFERRARSKNAVVVLDMSGSMNYTAEQLDEVLELARGAVVVGYSTANPVGNFHLLAKDGMRVAELPRHGGANGLDGLALTHAVNKYRKNSTTPIVWVSDGQVNGLGDSALLAQDMIRRLKKTGAHHVETLDEAIALLDRMANGHRPSPTIGRQLIEQAQNG